jgi:hypothetical protein
MAHNYGKAYEGESGLLFPAEEHETAFTSQLMSLIDTYTAEQSLLRAKEELEKVVNWDRKIPEIITYHDGKRWVQENGHIVWTAWVETRISELDKEIKASRLDAEGEEKWG